MVLLFELISILFLRLACHECLPWASPYQGRILDPHIRMANPGDSSKTQLRSKLAQIAIGTIAHGAHTVSFQPKKCPNEDRHLVEDWKLSNGTWKFLGVFDGSRLRLV